MSGRSRGMALIQALVIVAAIAAVATALLLRAEQARQRLELRAGADQAALYLDSGVTLVRAVLDALPAEGAVHRRQGWAQPREGVVIDRGTLEWTVDDLQGRFNLSWLAEDGTGAMRTAFLRLAADQGVPRSLASRIADALGPDETDRARATAPDAPPYLPLADPRQILPLAGDNADDLRPLLPFLSALPIEAEGNLNTLHPEVLRALLEGVDSGSLRLIERRLADAPFDTVEDFQAWADERLPPPVAQRLDGLGLAVRSTNFLVTLTARLDTVVLRRSVVVNRDDDAQGRSVVVLSIPEPE